MPVQVALENAIVHIEEAVEELPRVSAAKIGLDVRAGYVSVDTEDRCIIATDASVRSLDYYGGFEYVNDENKMSIGPYTIYMEESFDGETCKRVSDALDYFEEHQEAA